MGQSQGSLKTGITDIIVFSAFTGEERGQAGAARLLEALLLPWQCNLVRGGRLRCWGRHGCSRAADPGHLWQDPDRSPAWQWCSRTPQAAAAAAAATGTHLLPASKCFSPIHCRCTLHCIVHCAAYCTVRCTAPRNACCAALCNAHCTSALHCTAYCYTLPAALAPDCMLYCTMCC